MNQPSWSFRPKAVVMLALFSCALLLAGCAGGNSTNSSPSGSSTNSSSTSTSTSQPAPIPHLAVWTNNFNGVPFTMVGTDPSKPSSGITAIPVEIIPVTFTFSLANTVLSAQSVACGDNVGIVTRVVNSPIFTTNTWTDGSTVLGQTQFADAFQRGNFWTVVSTVSPNYHVMLQPVSVSAGVTVEVPLSATLRSNPAPVCPQPIATVPIGFMDAVVQNTIAAQHITADTLPIFLTYNTGFSLPAGGFYLGYHTVQGNQSYVVASYNDPGFNLFAYTASDVVVLSHEIGEWMDNPLGLNSVPPWGQFGIQPTCASNLEVGDPLTGSIYALPTPGFVYHVQELAYFSWFARNLPSLAVNGRYSTRGTFSTPAPPCTGP